MCAPRASSTLDGSDVVVLRSGLYGVDVESSRVDLSRIRVDGARTVGILADSSTGTFADVVVRDVTEADGPSPDPPAGVRVQRTADIALTRALVERVTLLGLATEGDGAHLAASDAVIRDVRPRATDGRGRGAQSAAGTTLELRRALVQRCPGAGIAVGGTTTLRDVTVEDGWGDSSTTVGGGILVAPGGRLDGGRLLLRRDRQFGIFADGQSTSSLTDVVVQGTRGTATNPVGLGLVAQDGAMVDVTRGLFADGRVTGVMALGPDTSVALTDVDIEDTRAADCASSSCAQTNVGSGAVSFLGASLDLQRFRVAGSTVCGLQVAQEGGLDARNGVVQGNAIGGCVQVDGYDTSRLLDGVAYLDNQANVVTTDLPLPDALPSLASTAM